MDVHAQAFAEVTVAVASNTWPEWRHNRTVFDPLNKPPSAVMVPFKVGVNR
jgi:hypothetical protein